MQIKNAPTTILVILLVVASFFIGTLWMRVQQLEDRQTGSGTANNLAAQGGSQPTPPPGDVPEINDNDWIMGNPDGNILLIEYSDLECPYCQQFHTTANQLIEKDNDVAWVYRHFPLDAIHPSARPRAIASECVGRLVDNDAFWEFIDIIFASETVADDDLASIATDLGANPDEYNTCIADASVEEKVDSDMAGGQSAGVSGTPGNFLMNADTGEVSYIPGAVPLAQLEQAIEDLR